MAWARDDGLWGEGERGLLDSALRKTRRRPGAVLAVGGVAARGEERPVGRLILSHALTGAATSVTLSRGGEGGRDEEGAGKSAQGAAVEGDFARQL